MRVSLGVVREGGWVAGWRIEGGRAEEGRVAREETLRSALWRNDDASNMSATDIRIGIPESASHRPEAHVFPRGVESRRVASGFLFFPARGIGFPRRLPSTWCVCACVRERVKGSVCDLAKYEEIARGSSIVMKGSADRRSVYRGAD